MERKRESEVDGENYDQVEERERLIEAAHTKLYAAVFVSNVRRNAAIDPSGWQWTDTEWIRLRPFKIYVVIVTFTHASHSQETQEAFPFDFDVLLLYSRPK